MKPKSSRDGASSVRARRLGAALSFRCEPTSNTTTWPGQQCTLSALRVGNADTVLVDGRAVVRYARRARARQSPSPNRIILLAEMLHTFSLKPLTAVTPRRSGDRANGSFAIAHRPTGTHKWYQPTIKPAGLGRTGCYVWCRDFRGGGGRAKLASVGERKGVLDSPNRFILLAEILQPLSLKPPLATLEKVTS
jgi:hypothetical protein